MANSESMLLWHYGVMDAQTARMEVQWNERQALDHVLREGAAVAGGSGELGQGGRSVDLSGEMILHDDPSLLSKHCILISIISFVLYIISFTRQRSNIQDPYDDNRA